VLLEQAVEAYGEDLPLALPDPQKRRKPSAASAPAKAPAPDRSTSRPTGRAPERAPERAQVQPTDRAAADRTAPETLASLREEVLACRKCKLCEGRTNVVFGEGAPKAEVMFIGEAPGQTEDETGRPFVGRAGQLLTKIIENAMGLRREDVFIANINKCRPPGNRAPEPDEVAACLPYLRRQIDLVSPKVIVCLGKTAAANLLGDTRSVGKLRGLALTFSETPVVVTWHPAYLLRNPAAKPETWADIKRVNQMLGRPEVPPRRTP
jgi:DNA polymerase